MRAVVCREHGAVDRLEVVDVESPRPERGQVVVEVAAAAANFPDVLIVADRYQVSVPTLFVPGSEFAGTVAEVSPGVEGLSVGDRVRGTTFHGAFAEQVVVDEERLAVVPDEVDLRDAAAFYVTHATAYHCLRSVAEIAQGEVLLVLGAGGGVGTAAVQLGSLLGAQVVAAASSEAKLDACRSLGATRTIDYGRVDLREALREQVPEGVDVVVDPVGGSLSEPALRSCRWGGRFVTVGFASGEIPTIALNLVLLKGVIVKGMEMRGFAEHRPRQLERDQRELDELLASGEVRPLIGETFALEDASAALAALADRRATGKILIVP